MGLVQWLGLLLLVYGLGVFAQGLRSWFEVRKLARREVRLRNRMRRLSPDNEQARVVAGKIADEEERIKVRLDHVTVRRCFTWGLWP
ncbi:MAG TPA: hypothetical protein VK869_07930 [Rubrobacteraceae bacterium]|nr:hypothetical protein [Rubrobacteraceae bacterium]